MLITRWGRWRRRCPQVSVAVNEIGNPELGSPLLVVLVSVTVKEIGNPELGSPHAVVLLGREVVDGRAGRT